jgi:ubiquinone biosynthesis protein Coq4
MRRLIRGYHAVRCYVTLARDPGRLDIVFGLRASLDDRERVQKTLETMQADPYYRDVLAARRRISTIDLDVLARLPEGTLGHVFAHEMRARSLDPTALPHLSSNDQGEYIAAHLYETHDIWHTVTGFATDIPGELGLQAFYAAQLAGPLPIAILSAGLLNTLLYGMDDREARMEAIARGWELGRRAKPLFGRAWDTMWDRPLDELRAELAIGTLALGGPRADARMAA